MNSQTIAENLQIERAQLEKANTLLATAERELDAAQKAFGADKITLEGLTAAQAKQMALSGQAHRLGLNIATLETEFVTAQADEQHEKAFDDLHEIAEQASVTFSTYQSTLESSFAQIEAAGRAVIGAQQSHHAERARFSAALEKLVPNAGMASMAAFGREDGIAARDALQSVRAELTSRGCDLQGIAASLGSHDIEVFNRDAYQLPTSYFQSELDEVQRKVRQLDANAKAEREPRGFPGEIDNAARVPSAGSGAWQVGISQTIEVVQ